MFLYIFMLILLVLKSKESTVTQPSFNCCMYPLALLITDISYLIKKAHFLSYLVFWRRGGVFLLSQEHTECSNSSCSRLPAVQKQSVCWANTGNMAKYTIFLSIKNLQFKGTIPSSAFLLCIMQCQHKGACVLFHSSP